MIEELIKEQIREIYLEAKEQAKKELLPVNQAELQEIFGFSNEYLKRLKLKGLKYRKQGKKKMYDVRDVYEILEKEKEYLKWKRSI